MNLLLILAAVFILHAEAFNYYITVVSNNGVPACVINSRKLSPCFQLYELNETLLSSHNSLTLFLLPGQHRLLSSYTFNVSQLKYLKICPLTVHQVEVKCNKQSKFVFQNIKKLEITAVNFTSCVIECIKQGPRDPPSSLYFANCTFADSAFGYSLSLNNIRNASMDYCHFESNNGAVLMETITSFFSSLIFIHDSTFKNNWRKDKGGAIYSSSVILTANLLTIQQG